MRFYAAHSLFMPFVRMKRPIAYFANRTNHVEYDRDFELIWDNHLFFNPRCRSLFESVTTSCWQPSIYSGEMSLRSGKRIEHSEELYANCNSNSSVIGDWKRLMEYLKMEKYEHEEPRRRMGGRRRQTKTRSKNGRHKNSRHNKTRSKTRLRNKHLG